MGVSCGAFLYDCCPTQAPIIFLYYVPLLVQTKLSIAPPMKKPMKRVLWLLPAALLLFIIWYAWPRLPIITAFAAKGMCSNIFLTDKEPERVKAEDLSFFPINLAKCTINYAERSVTSTVLGLARRKAVFRDGLGAVLVLEKPEEELRRETLAIPDPGYSQDTIPWPLGDMLSGELPAGVDYDRLEEVLDAAFDAPGEKPFKKTLGVAVVYENQLIGEEYLEGYDAWTKFNGWSMTKSIAGAMAIGLVMEDRMQLDVTAAFPEWANDERSTITLQNLLQMNSGLDWYENYFTISDATLMLMRSDNMLASVLDNTLIHEPGTHWNYSSGDINLMSGLVRRTIGDDEAYHAYAYSRLFHRIGMLNTVVETDASGLFVASSYCYGSTRDWARFGLLFLNDGIFEGDTVITPEWVDFMKSEAPASEGKYAGTFWLEESREVNMLSDVPEDLFFADGFQGQRVYIIPSKKLVVVRLGYSMTNFSMNDFLKEIIETLPV
jgi:CubicO group peptidase (beta-lactamase class C family)